MSILASQLNPRSADFQANAAAMQALDEQQVRAFCKGQIAHYKVPRYIRFVESFPMTVTGKIQKFRIREAMKGELDLKEEKTA